MKKYELTEDTKTLANGTVLHRIRALRNFKLAYGGEVSAGDLGGWVEKEDNLSQTGKAWVHGDAWVCQNAKVYGDAFVYENARVYDNVMVYGKAKVYGHAKVYGNAKVYDDANVCDNAWVYDDAQVYDSAIVFSNASVYDQAQVYGIALVYSNAKICGNAHVKGTHDYAVFKNTWSSGRIVTYTRSNKMWRAGCFYGTGEELITKAYKDSKLSGRCYEAIVRAQESIDMAVKEANANT